MIKIDSLRAYARRNKDKIIKTDPKKLAKANASIEKALKNAKRERAKAAQSAAEIFLSI